MESVLKETIIARLMLLPQLSDKYLAQDPSYVFDVAVWLKQTELKLEPLRCPLVSTLASLRGLLEACDDGYQDDRIMNSSRSKRKGKRALAASLLTRADTILNDELQRIENNFSEVNEKIAQLIALVFANQPLPIVQNITSAYLDSIWKTLGEHQETKSMYLYLQARISATDRRYLLSHLLINMIPETD
ncbi:hypothetical protein OFO16_17230 [Vibrio natriegens]|uniref:hypothetical protein n=1 Tax=Vibrio natriegens TaxID=691 RepID=UPI0021E8A2B0|nr:hypothetical protein [Vibrio natriegens]UYI49758.1 hypothetical protein OFO16_17230 [Vibrio natriegens]